MERSKILRPRGIRKFRPKKVKSTRGVVYFSHVPHGFYENEMRQFFTQFGKVTNINIPKSSRTGKYKGYGFVEFLYPEVAKVVAETMNNYLMFQKILKAKYIPPEEQKPYCFKFVKSKVPLLHRRRKHLRDRSNRELNEDECEKEVASLQKSLSKKRKKLESIGVNYEFQCLRPPSTENCSILLRNDISEGSEELRPDTKQCQYASDHIQSAISSEHEITERSPMKNETTLTSNVLSRIDSISPSYEGSNSIIVDRDNPKTDVSIVLKPALVGCVHTQRSQIPGRMTHINDAVNGRKEVNSSVDNTEFTSLVESKNVANFGVECCPEAYKHEIINSLGSRKTSQECKDHIPEAPSASADEKPISSLVNEQNSTALPQDAKHEPNSKLPSVDTKSGGANVIAPRALVETDAQKTFPDMRILLTTKKNEWNFKNPNMIRALYVESETNMLDQWKEKYTRRRLPSSSQIQTNRSSRLRRTYLQFKKNKTDRETTEEDRLRNQHSRGRPAFEPVPIQSTVTSEYRHAFARNRPPIPYDYLEYYEEHKKLPFKIVQTRKNGASRH